jgi:hypothetical protein
MWKRRLVVFVTFIAGLYYFLEFVVPATVPWQTVEGSVVSVSGETLVLQVEGQPREVLLQSNDLLFRLRERGVPERVEPAQLNAGDRVSVGPTTYLSEWLPGVNNFFIVLGAMAWGMGLLSLGMVHWGSIRRKKEEWYGSVIFFVAVGVGMFAGAGDGQIGTRLAVLNDLAVNRLINPMGSTIFSLLAFHMTTAAYRAFRVKSKEAMVMMAAAFVVMLGQIPVGLWLTAWLPDYLQLPVISQWVLYIANTAAVRGMWFGMMIGAIAVGLRFWLSLEKGAFFERGDE